MADKTAIEWTDATWNPIRGCSRVSDGCDHCYAQGVANRFSGPGQAYEGLVHIAKNDGRALGWNGQITFVEKHLLDPLRWNKPRRIFVNSMSDLFHENVTDEMRDRIFAVMALCPQHKFQILTKRAQQMADYMDGRSEDGCEGLRGALVEGMTQKLYSEQHPQDKSDISMWLAVPWPLPNVWLGVSVENQQAADERIPLLLQTPAAVRFLSCEPLLGPVEISRALPKVEDNVDGEYWEGVFFCSRCMATFDDHAMHECNASLLDWVIAGGESGRNARPMHPDWARSLRDQCAAVGVPFFFKQHGEWISLVDYDFFVHGEDAERYQHQFAWKTGQKNDSELPISCYRVGKKAAGDLLDGVQHHAFPEVSA